MRIQCKKCGKEYRVEESRLTSEGIRVKCRDCGAILLVRKRENGENREAEKAAVAGGSSGESPADSGESAPPSSYQYCISCGKGLDRAVPVGERPVCGTCESLGGEGRWGFVDDALGVPSAMPSRSRRWLYGFILVLLIGAAIMGYRIANGDQAGGDAVGEPAESQAAAPAVPKE